MLLSINIIIIIIPFLALLRIHVSSAIQQTQSLTTLYRTDTGQNGNMFDIEVTQNNASEGITIRSMDLHIKSLPGNMESYEIYTIEGGYSANADDDASWRMLGCATMSSNGPLQPTPLPMSGLRSLFVASGTKIGFYVTLTTGVSQYLYYSYGGIVGSVYVENTHLRIFEVSKECILVLRFVFVMFDSSFITIVCLIQGIGLIYPFQPIDTFTSRIWNGSIYYQTGDTTDSITNPVVNVMGDCMPSDVPSHPPTKFPTKSPTKRPTRMPSAKPTRYPTRNPTRNPTRSPTKRPTSRPTRNPTQSPTKNPTSRPTKRPTPIPTKNPTPIPSIQPNPSPSNYPSILPTVSASLRPSPSPTLDPTSNPTTPAPTTHDHTHKPTREASTKPTNFPSPHPTDFPTRHPTLHPTKIPTIFPTSGPSMLPEVIKSSSPSLPSLATLAPVRFTENPSLDPTPELSSSPSNLISSPPSEYPSNPILPSFAPTYPSLSPSLSTKPSHKFEPTSSPSFQPSSTPSTEPTLLNEVSIDVLVACIASAAAAASAASSLAATAAGDLDLYSYEKNALIFVEKPILRVTWKEDEALTEVRYYHRSSFQIYDEQSLPPATYFKRKRRERKKELVQLKNRIKSLADAESKTARENTMEYDGYSVVV